MSFYLGREPVYGKFEKQSFTGDGTTTTYALDYSAPNASSLLVSVGGVIQEPGVSYNVNATPQIMFTEAPPNGSRVYIIFVGQQINVPIPIGGGATGGGSDQVFVENDNTINSNYEIPLNRNAMTVGPVEITEGVTVTIPSGSRWVIV